MIRTAFPPERVATWFATLALGLALALAPLAGGAQASEMRGDIREALSGALTAVGGGGIRVGRATERLAALRAFYDDRDHAPLWLDGDRPSPRAGTALALLADATREGLDPTDYTSALPTDGAAFGTAADAARFELVLSDALLRYLTDLRTGRFAPALYDPGLFVSHESIDLARALTGLAGTGDLRAFAAGHAPPNPVYRALRSALAAYRRLEAQGGWPDVPPGEKVEAGSSGPRVAALRRRLAASADLHAEGEAPEIFDEELRAAVVRFQRRHGLDPDGVVGPKTLAAANLPVSERIRAIVLNMERWRWMPDDLGRRHILVNIAGFELHAVEDGSIRLAMKVVVGRQYRHTPVFSGTMTYLEFAPYWHVPPRIAANDLLPKIRANPDYLAAEGFRVFDGWGAGARPLDPAGIDWATLGPRRFPYKLRQEPGPKNALGRVKFMFPNEHDVYLHDTPSRELFRRTVRAFSSGCIRVERPADLAAFVLDGQAGEDRATIEAALASQQTRIVSLDRQLAVHLTYLTAWAAEDGTVQFRDDIYGRDAALEAALAAGE